jgi:hypothetical protein
MKVKDLVNYLKDVDQDLDVNIIYKLNETDMFTDKIVAIAAGYNESDSDAMEFKDMTHICLVGALCENKF